MSVYPGNRKWEREHSARYTCVTKGMPGLGQDLGLIFHEDALDVRSISPDERKALSKGFHPLWKPTSFLDSPDFASNDGRVSFRSARPQIGGVGWRRFPGLDHYEVWKDGKIVFRTASYRYVLKYLRLYAERNPQPLKAP